MCVCWVTSTTLLLYEVWCGREREGEREGCSIYYIVGTKLGVIRKRDIGMLGCPLLGQYVKRLLSLLLGGCTKVGLCKAHARLGTWGAEGMGGMGNRGVCNHYDCKIMTMVVTVTSMLLEWLRGNPSPLPMKASNGKRVLLCHISNVD